MIRTERIRTYVCEVQCGLAPLPPINSFDRHAMLGSYNANTMYHTLNAYGLAHIRKCELCDMDAIRHSRGAESSDDEALDYCINNAANSLAIRPIISPASLAS
jgi:hypothetical protein